MVAPDLRQDGCQSYPVDFYRSEDEFAAQFTANAENQASRKAGSDSESMLVDTQARNPRFESLTGHAELHRCATGPRNAAVRRLERRLDNFLFPIDEGCGQRTSTC